MLALPTRRRSSSIPQAAVGPNLVPAFLTEQSAKVDRPMPSRLAPTPTEVADGRQRDRELAGGGMTEAIVSGRPPCCESARRLIMRSARCGRLERPRSRRRPGRRNWRLARLSVSDVRHLHSSENAHDVVSIKGAPVSRDPRQTRRATGATSRSFRISGERPRELECD